MSDAASEGARRRALQALAALPLAAGLPDMSAAADPPSNTDAPPPRRISFHTSDGVRLSALEARPAHLEHGAPTVLLLPGWCMPATVWKHQLRALGARWRTIALDPRGQGESQAPVHGYDFDRRADDISEVRHKLGHCVLVGWSLAALEVLQLLHRHGAGGVQGVVLVDSSVGEPPVPPSVGGFVDQLRADRVTTVHDFVRAVFSGSLNEAEMQEIEQAALRMPLEGAARLLSDTHPREHWRRIARAIRPPLAYVVTPQFQEQAGNLVKERPATQVEVFANAGHALFLAEPERFNGVMMRFLEGVGGRR